jgi:hypothetical protein
MWVERVPSGMVCPLLIEGKTDFEIACPNVLGFINKHKSNFVRITSYNVPPLLRKIRGNKNIDSKDQR